MGTKTTRAGASPTFTISTTLTDDLIRFLGNYRYSYRGSMGRQLRNSINCKMRAIELTLAERGMSAEWIANISYRKGTR